MNVVSLEQQQERSSEPPRIYTKKQFCERNRAITDGALRWDIFNAELNGLAESGALIRRGRKILVDEVLYFAWLRSRGQKRVA